MHNEYEDEYDDTYMVMEERRVKFDNNKEDVEDLSGSDDDRKVSRVIHSRKTGNSTRETQKQ